MSLSVEPYDPDRHAEEWDAAARAASNAHFQFERAFMDHHAHRFADASLLLRRKGRLAALLPAERTGDLVRSHGGLSFGGLVLSGPPRQAQATALLAAAAAHFREAGAARFVCRAMPAIYGRPLMQADRPALFALGARVIRCDAAAALPPGGWAPLPARRRQVQRAARSGACVARSDDWPAYWRLLTDRLETRHAARPVHGLAEIERLAAAFPDSILLLAARLEGEVRAGAVIFRSPTVDRVQYMATDAEARRLGLLDLVLERAAREAGEAGRWLDLGTSMDPATGGLNAGLADYKESTGAAPLACETWELDLA
jgi:hypothetical protein